MSPRIKLTDEITVDVIDPQNIPVTYADLVTEVRTVNGVLYISLANLVVEGDNVMTRTAHVCARLRIAQGTAEFLQRVLSDQNQQIPPTGQTLN